MKQKLPFFVLNKKKGLSIQHFGENIRAYVNAHPTVSIPLDVNENLKRYYKNFLKKVPFKKEVAIAFADMPRYKDGSITAGCSIFAEDTIPIILLNINVIGRTSNRKIGLDTLKTTLLHEMGHVVHFPNVSEELADHYALKVLSKVDKPIFAFMMNDLLNMVFDGKSQNIADMYVKSAKRNLKKFGVDWKKYRLVCEVT